MDLGHQKDIDIKLAKENLLYRFFRLFSIRGKSEIIITSSEAEEQELIENIKTAKNEWINANTNFDYADEQELIDYYTYKIKACQVRYEYYIKKAKEKGIRIDSLDTAQAVHSGDHISY